MENKIKAKPGTDVPRATSVTAVKVSCRPTEQPKWVARFPMKAESKPIITMDTRKADHPFNAAVFN